MVREGGAVLPESKEDESGTGGDQRARPATVERDLLPSTVRPYVPALLLACLVDHLHKRLLPVRIESAH
jgi:hypothetical protein